VRLKLRAFHAWLPWNNLLHEGLSAVPAVPLKLASSETDRRKPRRYLTPQIATSRQSNPPAHRHNISHSGLLIRIANMVTHVLCTIVRAQ
jgi:hypothetical protein